MKSRHDEYLNHLVEELLETEQYQGIVTNAKYGNSHRLIGEIDVVGIYGKLMDFYEVKSFPSRGNLKKALDQLSRAREYFKKDLEGDNFIYTPHTGIITPEKAMSLIEYN